MVLGGSAAILSALTLSPTAQAAALEQTLRINRTAGPAAAARKPLAFELFYDLSRYVTARADLDVDAARDLHEHFAAEEWGHVIAARVYANLRTATSDGTASGPAVLAARTFDDLDQWYCEHILDAWYEGMYRYDGLELRVLYEDALMWTPVADALPVAGLSDRDYGFWTERPASGENE